MMWSDYFYFILLVPGKVVTREFGPVDFSKDNLPVAVCRKLYESGFPYLQLTKKGKSELYGIKQPGAGKFKSKRKNTGSGPAEAVKG